jgi:hypothetical protein
LLLPKTLVSNLSTLIMFNWKVGRNENHHLGLTFCFLFDFS